MSAPTSLPITLVDLPEDPEPAAVYLQELAVDLAEAIDADAAWQASLGEDAIAVRAGDFGFALRGGEAWSVELWGPPAQQRAMREAVEADARVLWRIGPDQEKR